MRRKCVPCQMPPPNELKYSGCRSYEQRFRFAIAMLLPQIGAHGRTAVMPDKAAGLKIQVCSRVAAIASRHPHRPLPFCKADRNSQFPPKPICKTPCCSREYVRRRDPLSITCAGAPGETCTAAATSESSGGRKLWPPMPANLLFNKSPTR